MPAIPSPDPAVDAGEARRTDDDTVAAPWLFEVEGRVWAMRPELLATLHDLARQGASLEHAQDAMGDMEAARSRSGPPVQGGVAVVSLSGVLMPQVSLLALIFGIGGGLPAFRSDLRAALADDAVSSIVLDVDSPGGLVDLIPEIAAEVRAAREQKPIYAVANTLAASAAYWIASQADEIHVTPSGEIGSIGVYATHRDMSRMYDAAGITTTLISAGKYKVEGNPYEPLGDEARAALQEGVNDYYDLFVRAVAAGRGVKPADVRSGYGQGRTLTAKRAVEAGLADRVSTLEETVARAAGGRRRSTGARAEAEAGASPERDHEQDRAEAEAGAAEGVTYSREERERLVDAL